MQIKINQKNIENLKKIVDNDNKDNYDEIVNKILSEYFAKNTDTKTLSQEDEEKIKERLRGLGYLE